ncbi:hypothetical protein [Streptomyces sp. NPDC056165]|uniref:hypothetical protein n=1 Tax=Streptomyces sp. NPDC056165 TaxID=3345733 RepID=UPI0035E0CECA
MVAATDRGPSDDITVHLDPGYDSDKTRTLLNERGLHGRIAHGFIHGSCTCVPRNSGVLESFPG